MSKERPRSQRPKRPARGKGLAWGIAVLVLAAIVSWAAYERRRPASVQEGESIGVPASAPTKALNSPPPSPAPDGMVWIPGGEFSMGSDAASEPWCGLPGVTRDALPIHRVYVDGFWMDATEVTNEQFEKFVKATGYITVAEQTPTREEFPAAPPENLVAGSTVFTPTPQPVPLDNFYQWWSYVPGADWRHPAGPGSDLKGRQHYPVVQIAYEDAAAYATWAGKRLPTEAE